MNENATKWIAALRSGEYQQTEGRLQDSQGANCCLGVACRLFIEIEGEDDLRAVGQSSFEAYNGDTDEWEQPDEELLPWPVRNWLGMKTDDGRLATLATGDSNRSVSLVTLNDDGADFDQIAHVIEHNAEDLFE